jgi:hypothetical protein
MTATTATRSRNKVSNDTYTDVVVAALRGRLREVASVGDASLSDLLGRPEALAARVAAVVPTPSRLAATIGPVYRQASLAAACGHSRQAVSDLIKRRRVLALTTKDGHVVIPAFQLGDDLRPLNGIPEILQILTPDVIDEWTLASWLTAAHDQLGAKSVVEYLAAGNEPARAFAVAEAAKRRWSV